VVLSTYRAVWAPTAPIVRGPDAAVGHARTIRMLRRADASTTLVGLARSIGRMAFPARPTSVGGVRLPHPLIVAAGLVKGDGFATTEEALAAVAQRRDIVPGWRSLPALVGAVELGSFTPQPRPGNRGRVHWRHEQERSMQNRVGLRNPGAAAASAFLAGMAEELPPTWGLNLAPSPGVDGSAQAAEELTQAAGSFRRAFQGRPNPPAWLTLNLSCPNTEDDPHGRQTEELARRLTTALRSAVAWPLWVKVGPDLSDDQLEGLVSALAETGVAAIVAANTVARPVPGDSGPSAGLSGAGLRPLALATVRRLADVSSRRAASIDIVGCGGILEGSDLRAFMAAGARAGMIYSALVFRGPLAGALILHEADGRADA
jgi:dihydroorotate dehydrogenase